MKTTPSTSTGGEAKIKRAANQIGNAYRLIAGLPKRYYEQKANDIKEITHALEKLKEKIEKDLPTIKQK